MSWFILGNYLSILILDLKNDWFNYKKTLTIIKNEGKRPLTVRPGIEETPTLERDQKEKDNNEI